MFRKKIIHLLNYSGIFCLVIALLLKFCLTTTFIERYYSNSFFFSYRQFFNHVSGAFPFPFSYFFILLIISITVFILFKKRHKYLLLANLFCFLGAYFLWAWGFNYERRSQDELLQLSVTPLTKEQIIHYLDIEIKKCDSLFRTKDNFSIADIKDAITIQGMQEHLVQNIPIRSQPPGSLMHMGITGIYFPFTGEANYDEGLHQTRKPFVIAHELFHALGYASESDCNFLAYIHLSHAKNSFLQYSASLELLTYLLLELKQNDPPLYLRYRKNLLPKVLQVELDAIKKKHARYHGWLSDVGDAFNNFYLKSQGVKDGTENYSAFVPMAIAWNERKQ